MADDRNERVYYYLSLPEGAYEILERDSKRLQKTYKRRVFWLDVRGSYQREIRQNLRWLLTVYAWEIKQQRPIPIKVSKTKRHSVWRGKLGKRTRIGVTLPKIAFDILRERARRMGYLWGNKGCISHMLQDHAWELWNRFWRLGPDKIFIPGSDSSIRITKITSTATWGV